MPWNDVAGAGSGPECWFSDHSIRMFELWAAKSSRCGTSTDHVATLNRRHER